MKIMRYLLLLFIFSFYCSNYKNDENTQNIDSTKVDWTGINVDKFSVKFGDRIQFKVDNKTNKILF